MIEYEQNEWGYRVALHLCHSSSCACCDGSGEKDAHWRELALYSVLIIPSESRDMNVAQDLNLNGDDLELLVNLITKARTMDSSEVESEIWVDTAHNASVSFSLIQNSEGQLGEYSLKIVGSGFDDVLPVDSNELRAFLEEVSEMKESEDAYRSGLAEEEDREREVKSRTKGKTLREIEDEARRAEAFLSQDDQELKFVRVLLAAAFFVGSNIDRLVSFTGYSRDFIAEIAVRMDVSGLWVDGEVRVGHWFDSEFKWTKSGFFQDWHVAIGSMVKCCCGQSGALEYCSSGRSW